MDDFPLPKIKPPVFYKKSWDKMTYEEQMAQVNEDMEISKKEFESKRKKIKA